MTPSESRTGEAISHDTINAGVALGRLVRKLIIQSDGEDAADAINELALGSDLIANGYRTPPPAGEGGEALREALEPLALLAATEDSPGANMNDPLSKWFTVAQLHRARYALQADTGEGGKGPGHTLRALANSNRSRLTAGEHEALTNASHILESLHPAQPLRSGEGS